VHFDTVEEAAAYLQANPDSGIRMFPGWKAIYRNIVIAFDEN
jgi:hypothetical protein